MKFGTYLLALVEPLLAKILLALGFSVVSIVGVDTALTTIKGLIVANMGAAGSLLDFALYMWIGKGIGLIFGACATKFLLWQVQNATKIMGKTNG
jgi:hypothetical protein